jgi:hypothetical protein
MNKHINLKNSLLICHWAKECNILTLKRNIIVVSFRTNQFGLHQDMPGLTNHSVITSEWEQWNLRPNEFQSSRRWVEREMKYYGNGRSWKRKQFYEELQSLVFECYIVCNGMTLFCTLWRVTGPFLTIFEPIYAKMYLVVFHVFVCIWMWKLQHFWTDFDEKFGMAMYGNTCSNVCVRPHVTTVTTKRIFMKFYIPNFYCFCTRSSFG